MDELEENQELVEKYKAPVEPQPPLPPYSLQPTRPSMITLLFQNKLRAFLLLGFLFILIGGIVWSVGAGVNNTYSNSSANTLSILWSLQHVVAPIFVDVGVFFLLIGCVEGILVSNTEAFVKIVLAVILLFIIILLFLAFAYSTWSMFSPGS